MRRSSLLPVLTLLVAAASAVELEQRFLRCSSDAKDGRSLAASCGIPEFSADWESQGALVGKDLVVTGGFLLPTYTNVTRKTYSYSAGSTTNAWKKRDDFPLAVGVTHAAVAAAGQKMYVCGGYIGGQPGQATAKCYVYDHSATAGSQWTSFTELPETRAGGGLVYDNTANALIFAGGAWRPTVGSIDAEDKVDAWKISLKTSGAKVARINEKAGNVPNVIEYRVVSDAWTNRAPLPLPRGHASYSTIAYGCGFLIAGGAINGVATKAQTNDISYYHIPTGTWRSMGKLVNAARSIVCAVHEDYLYCTSGSSKNSWRRALKLVDAPPPLTAPSSPSAPPPAARIAPPLTNAVVAQPVMAPTVAAAPPTPAQHFPVDPDTCLEQWHCKGLFGLRQPPGYTMHVSALSGFVGDLLCIEFCTAENLVVNKSFYRWECGPCPS